MTSPMLPEGYELIDCDARHADEALLMLRAILAELADSGLEQYYYMSETDDEFRSYYPDPAMITLGVRRDGRLVACGTASFRREETARFDGALPEVVPPETIGSVEYIHVVKEHRGKGLQPALFAALEAELLKRGARYFTGVVSPLNKASYNNFVKRGYREVGKTTLSNGFERLLMAKKAQ